MEVTDHPTAESDPQAQARKAVGVGQNQFQPPIHATGGFSKGDVLPTRTGPPGAGRAIMA